MKENRKDKNVHYKLLMPALMCAVADLQCVVLLGEAHANIDVFNSWSLKNCERSVSNSSR